MWQPGSSANDFPRETSCRRSPRWAEQARASAGAARRFRVKRVRLSAPRDAPGSTRSAAPATATAEEDFVIRAGRVLVGGLRVVDELPFVVAQRPLVGRRARRRSRGRSTPCPCRRACRSPGAGSRGPRCGRAAPASARCRSRRRCAGATCPPRRRPGTGSTGRTRQRSSSVNSLRSTRTDEFTPRSRTVWLPIGMPASASFSHAARARGVSSLGWLKCVLT